MTSDQNTVTFKGAPLTLIGNIPAVGDPVPSVQLTANDLSSVDVVSYKGKVCVISCVPSLDTPVCDTQTRKFNTQAAELGDNVVVLTVSMDLPFAQSRWCAAAGIERVITLSDYKTAEFASKFGLLIEQLHLLARAVLVVDTEGIIRYVQLVPEMTDEPDYDAVINAVKDLL